MNRRGSWVMVLAVSMIALPVGAQHGGGGCGDVFGDLIHILRDIETGQPILQMRWIEMPKELPGYGWGYCPIAVDDNGVELGFAPLSCDVAEVDADRVVEVDYFGRLNGGRTKERNNRMHFDEVISTISGDDVGVVKTDETGRLRFGYDCSVNPGGQIVCPEWAVVDSPMESMGLFKRIMKYGHFQTDPEEVDEWHHGDPALGTQYHPALDFDDWAKFPKAQRHLLPMGGDAELCFPLAEDGLARGFNPDCAATEPLDARDFTHAAVFVGGAANKTGKATVDLAQYFNRIVKIPIDTPHTTATAKTLPALVRACPTEPAVPDPDAEDQTEPVYDMDGCEIIEAHDGLENYEHFPDVQERFVDYADAEYVREDFRNELVEVIRPDANEGWWLEDGDVELLGWLGFANGADPGEVRNVTAFVNAVNDTIRSIEFVHNYAIPVDLGWNFEEAVD